MFLQASGVRLYYKTLRGAVRAVDNVSLSLKEVNTLGLVGESGCGKTSLAIAILRLLPKNVSTYKGSILLDGTELMSLSNEEFRSNVRWSKISMVFQGAMNSLNPVLKVGRQVEEPLKILAGVDKKERRAKVLELFEKVGLSKDIYKRYSHELSGGMKQRVIIAMSLVLTPKLVILDEPTSAIDVSVQAQIMNLLKRLKREENISMIFITHDIALATDLADMMGVMYGGWLVAIGTAEQVILSPKHPYTQKLLSSTPRLRSYFEPEFIPGAPPDLVNPPKGCRFHPRCPKVMEKCKIEEPLVFDLGEGHLVKCWLYGDKHGRTS